MSEHIGEKIKAVFFDHDDTLVGTKEAKWAQHKHIAKLHYNKTLTDEELSEHWGKPLGELLCLIYGTDDEERALGYVMEAHKEFPKVLFTATIPTIERLKSAEKLVGIITATNRFSFEHDLDLHNIPRECIDYTQTAEETSFHKPDARVFDPAIEWLSEMKVEPHEVVYVGDGVQDMKASVGAGFNFIGVETGLVTADKFKEIGAISIKTLEDLTHHGV